MERVRGCLICGVSEQLPLLSFRPDAYRRMLSSCANERVRFVVCRECSFIYQSPRFTTEELKAVYGEEARKETVGADGIPRPSYLEFTRTKSQLEFEWLRPRLPQGGGGRVLEVGCATGQLLRHFKDEGWRAVGVEPSRAFADYGSRVHDLPIVPALFEETELEPEFDLVIMSQVLEHVLDPEQVLTRAASLLTPTGRIYVSVPYYPARLTARPARELFISVHLHIFSSISLANLASHCKLSVETEGATGIYLRAILRPQPTAVPRLDREDPRAVRRRVLAAALRYFVVHESYFLLAQAIKRRLVSVLGETRGPRAVEAVRRLKQKLPMRMRR